MKTRPELDQILDALMNHDQFALRRGDRHIAIKLLRSIELDAWREAREVVERDGAKLHKAALAEMDRLIQQLQLK